MPAMTRRDEVREVEQRVGAKDPVCGMSVDPTRAAARREHAGETYFFCSTRCAEKFDAAPQSYLSERPQPARSSAGRCDLHLPDAPRDRAGGPGDCPICGMALEPKTMSAEDEGPSAELRDMTRRFWVSAALALPLLVWVMGDHLLGPRPRPRDPAPARRTGSSSRSRRRWCFGPAGRSSSAAGHRSCKMSPNMWTLIGIGVGAAYLYSVVATARARHLPGRVPRPRRPGRGLFRGRGGDHRPGPARPGARDPRARADQRRDQGAARPRAQDRAPRARGRQRRGGAARARSQVGDRLRVRPGEKIPVDGVVLEGRSTVDEVDADRRAAAGREGAGRQGRPAARSTSPAASSCAPSGSAARPCSRRSCRWSAEAQRSRAPIQRLVDVVAGWFVPAVVAVAVLAFIAWSIFGPPPAMAYAPGRRGLGADHRLSLRARARDADVDHGRAPGAAPRRAC